MLLQVGSVEYLIEGKQKLVILNRGTIVKQ